MFIRTRDAGIRRISDGALIPSDIRNADYQAFLAWVATQPGGVAPVEPALTPAEITAEFDNQVRRALDDERLISAVVWAVIDTYSAPATRTKYLAARTKILAAYRDRPWLT